MRRVSPRLALCALLALGGATLAAPVVGSDALVALQSNPSPAATRKLAEMYRRTGSTYERLWLLDALYDRVRQYRDPVGLEALIRASRDADADVRRRAIGSLEAFHYMKDDEIRSKWLPLIDAVVKRANADRNERIRAAGRQLEAVSAAWREARSGVQDSRERAESGDSFASSSPPLRQLPGLLIWAICFHLLTLGWQWMAVALLRDSDRMGKPVMAVWRQFRSRPAWLVFPAVACGLLILTLGGALVAVLIASELPGGGSAPEGWGVRLGAVAVLYAVSGMSCFLPAATLAGLAVSSGRGWTGRLQAARAVLRRYPGVAVLGLLLLSVWPLEILRKALRVRFPSKGLGAWALRTGMPFVSVLAAAVMVRENLGWRRALHRAFVLFPEVHLDPATELFGRAVCQPQFFLPALAAFPLMGFSLLPAAALTGFNPAQLFGWWFMTPVTCAVGVGVWTGMLLSAGYLALLWCLGGFYAARLVSEKEER